MMPVSPLFFVLIKNLFLFFFVSIMILFIIILCIGYIYLIPYTIIIRQKKPGDNFRYLIKYYSPAERKWIKIRKCRYLGEAIRFINEQKRRR